MGPFLHDSGGALTLALLTACSGDVPVTSPGVAYPSLMRDSLAPGLALEQRLAPIPANENTCTFRTVERDTRGAFVRWRPTQTERVSVARGPADTVLTRYELYTFSATGDQTAEAQCVRRRGAAARAFALAFFARPTAGATAAVISTVPVRPPLATITAGTTCLLDVVTLEMTCGNQTCFPMFASRVPTRARHGVAASVTRATPVGATPAGLVGGWECSGGGWLSLNGNGTLTYHPPGSGDGDGDGGTGDGCGGATPGDSLGDGTVTPPGSGGNDYSWWGAACADTIAFQTEDERLYCPTSHPKCLDTLTSADVTKIMAGMALVNTSDADCFASSQMVLQRLLASPRRLYKGSSGIADDPKDVYDAQTSSDKRIIHIDSDFLTEPVANVARLLMHEGWHAHPEYPGHPLVNAPPYPFPYSKADQCVLSS